MNWILVVIISTNGVVNDVTVHPNVAELACKLVVDSSRDLSQFATAICIGPNGETYR
jgi:hypothetical protein